MAWRSRRGASWAEIFFVKMIRGGNAGFAIKDIVKSNIPELPRAFLNFAFLC
jgi:hypothetical protein